MWQQLTLCAVLTRVRVCVCVCVRVRVPWLQGVQSVSALERGGCQPRPVAPGVRGVLLDDAQQDADAQNRREDQEHPGVAGLRQVSTHSVSRCSAGFILGAFCVM